jgi:TATA-binding protein-associated factor
MFTEDGSPWMYPKWQFITGVHHDLFPQDDSHLPKPWTREDANNVKSYFDQYSKKVKEDDKIKFASAKSGGTQVPGRDFWRKWVTDCWKGWKIHSKIIEVLSSENLHPLTLALSSKSRSLDTWPSATQYVPMAVDPVGTALFGVDCLDDLGRVSSEIRQTTQALIQRTWLVLYNQIQRSKGRIAELEKQATDAFNGKYSVSSITFHQLTLALELDKETVTKRHLKAIIVKVARWKAVAETLQTKENLDKIEAMDGELHRLMLGLGATLKDQAPTSKEKKSKHVLCFTVINTGLLCIVSDMCKTNSSALQQLASEEDVADVIALYMDFFNTPPTADSVPLTNQQPLPGLQTMLTEGDPGIEIEASMSEDDLSSNLGFPQRLPITFNTHRHGGGLSAWDHPGIFDPALLAQNPDMEPIALHWHQLAGVHAIIRMLFTKDPTPRACGVLISDEVGLGKTFQAATTIAFLSDLKMRQNLRQTQPDLTHNPPLIGKLSFNFT